jgi:hypothetical protein
MRGAFFLISAVALSTFACGGSGHAVLDGGDVPDVSMRDGCSDGSCLDAIDATDSAFDASMDIAVIDAQRDSTESDITDPLDTAPNCETGTLCGAVCVDLDNDPAHCGGCDNQCPGVPEGEPRCVQGACEILCSIGFHRCGSDCVPDTSITQCGPDCIACTEAPENAVAMCDGTACGFRCDPGFEQLADRCEPITVPIAAPRPIRPLSTSRVTSRRPTLAWELPAGLDGARVELCADRACEQPIVIADVTGTQFRPARLLPP